MDQELKQRLIGAAVITALATIFVPMLFDDPIDETGKNINELKIPEIPAKVQEVEIMPLPEKVEDVATEAPIEKPELPQVRSSSSEGNVSDAGMQDEAELEAPKPKLKLTKKETASPARHAQVIEPDMDVVDETPPRIEASKPAKNPVTTPVAPAPVTTAAKPAPAKPVEVKSVTLPLPAVEAPAKATPAASASGAETATPANRWYLNAGSFTQKNNALAQQDNLQQQGFAASIKEVATDKGTIYKVRIGPMLDKSKVQAVKSKLAQINVNTFISGDE